MTQRRVGPEIGLTSKRERELQTLLLEHFSGKVYVSTVDLLQWILSEPSFSIVDRVYLALLAGRSYEPSRGFEGT